MKYKKIIDRKLYLNSIRNIFSIIGVFSVLFLLISWTFTVRNSNDQLVEPSTPTPDVNITKAVAVNFINTYHEKGILKVNKMLLKVFHFPCCHYLAFGK
ncbi:MAG: hypothetical protein IPM91_14120 [Bacteroidetes bacterium]|nr:hypothetical protein [Bacteroidota bacterium]